MSYIIERVQVLKDDSVKPCSLLIKDNRIDYISNNLNRLPYMKMNTTDFILTPGHIMLDITFPLNMTFPQFKDYFHTNFLQKGCTTVLIGCEVQFESELTQKLKTLRLNLMNCPIDYYICVKIPLRVLTPSFLRQCKKLKIPVVFIEISDETKLEEIPWGWIRDAVYGYFLPLVPILKLSGTTPAKNKKVLARWGELTNDHHVPAIPYSLDEHVPLNKNVLMKIGIYPLKGEIRIGGEVDYNLYFKEDLYDKVAQTINVDYHIHSPKITVHKNKLIKVGNDIHFRPGFGDECIVKVPGFFKAYF